MYHLLVSDEDPTKLSLIFRGHDKLDDLRNGEDGTVEAQGVIIIGEKYVGASLNSSFVIVIGLCVRVDSNNCATGALGDAVAGVGGDIIKELISCIVDELGVSILLSSKLTDSNK